MKYLIIFILFIASCKPNSIITNSTLNYFSETNIYKTVGNITKLSQRVRLNNTKNGLHSSWYFLNIEINKISNHKKIIIKKDTSIIKVNYECSSQRNWGKSAKSINGSITILEIKENSIRIKEKLVVINDSGEVIKFKGIRLFQRNGNMDIYPEMRKN